MVQLLGPICCLSTIFQTLGAMEPICLLMTPRSEDQRIWPKKKKQLQCSVDNCTAMQVGHSLNSNSELGRAGSTVTLTEMNIEVDHGVSAANDLNPAVQCEQPAAKAMRGVRMIPSFFFIEDLDVSGFRKVYKTYVRPTLIMQFRPGHYTTRKTSNA